MSIRNLHILILVSAAYGPRRTCHRIFGLPCLPLIWETQ